MWFFRVRFAFVCLASEPENPVPVTADFLAFHMNHRLLVFSMLFIECRPSTNKAHFLEHRQSTAPHLTGQAEPRGRFDSVNDLCGLGIRLGVYLQTLAVLVAGAWRQTTSMESISLAGSKLSMLTALSIVALRTAEFNVVKAGIVLCTHEAIHFQTQTKGR